MTLFKILMVMEKEIKNEFIHSSLYKLSIINTIDEIDIKQSIKFIDCYARKRLDF